LSRIKSLPSTSFPVRYEMAQLSEDMGYYKKFSWWAEPDLDHASELMRLVYNGGPAVAQIAKNGSDFIRDNYGILPTGLVMKKRLREIYSYLYSMDVSEYS